MCVGGGGGSVCVGGGGGEEGPGGEGGRACTDINVRKPESEPAVCQ